MNKSRQFTWITLVLSCLATASFSFSLFSLDNHSTTHTKSGGKATLNIKSAKNFSSKTAKMNQCYLKSETSCNGQDMRNFYWSDNPKQYWSTVNDSYNNNTTWHSPANTINAPLPSQATSPAATMPPANHGSNTTPAAPIQMHTVQNTTETQSDNAGSFIIS